MVDWGNSPEAAPLGFWPQPLIAASGACLPPAMGNSSALSCSVTSELTRVNSATAANVLKINAN